MMSEEVEIWFPEERVLRAVILPELEQGRPDFDLPHTEAVVYWMKRILTDIDIKGYRNAPLLRQPLSPTSFTEASKVERLQRSRGFGGQALLRQGFGGQAGIEYPGIDVKVVVTAAYAHDWGYIGLFAEGGGFDKVMAMKPLHMQRGAEKIEKLLRKKLSESYTDEQIERVAHLVRVHDRLDMVKDEDELLLVEADTLGALDADRVKPTFSKPDNDKYLVELGKKRRPLFVHDLAIEVYDELLQKRIKCYEK